VAAAIMFAAFVLSIYFARAHTAPYEINERHVKVGG
jgi:hypothetical protein